MEPLRRTLHKVFGQARFGLYSFADEGRTVALVASSQEWPPAGVDPMRVLREPGLWTALPEGRIQLLPDASDSGRTLRARRLGALPLGPPPRFRGALLVAAGPGAKLWDWSREDCATLGDYLDAHLQLATLERRFDSLRGFHAALLEALPVGVVWIDRNRRISYLSRSAGAIVGCDPEETTGIDCLRVFRPSGVEENPLLLGLRGRATTVELYLTGRDGTEKPVWMKMSRLAARPDQRSEGMLVLLRDTSEERLFEEDRRRQERLASIGELSAGVAHEIRNPLTGIANCAQVLRDRLPPDDPRLRLVGIILSEAERLNRIVESLLSFARPGRPSLRETQVADLLGRLLELEGDRLRREGIEVEVKAKGRIPKIFIDPEQITQVLLNVVRNSAEAMTNGGRLTLDCSMIRRRPHLRKGMGQRRDDRIRYDRGTPLRRYVQLRVEDTGGGIPHEILPRVFDPFFTTRSKGTGLGLSISQSIVKEHGGFLSIRSIEGKGTVVLIDLPVERREGERRKRHE